MTQVWLGWALTSDDTQILDQTADPINPQRTEVNSNPTIVARQTFAAAEYQDVSGLGRIVATGVSGSKLDVGGEVVSLECWFELDSNDASGIDRRIFGCTGGQSPSNRWILITAGRAGSGNDNMCLRLTTVSGYFEILFDLGSRGALSGSAHHLLIRVDLGRASGRVEGFFDGVSQGTDDSISQNDIIRIFNNPVELAFGCAHSSGERHYDGWVFKGGYYDAWLSNAEVADRFAQGPGPDGAPPGDEAPWAAQANIGAGFAYAT